MATEGLQVSRHDGVLGKDCGYAGGLWAAVLECVMKELDEAREQTLNQQKRLDESSLTLEERHAIATIMHLATSSGKVRVWAIRFLVEDLLSDMDLFNTLGI